eukprot:1153792-Pelagomonas_calceolata.AAC.8
MDTFNTKEALVASVTLDICSSSCAWNLQASGNFKKKRHEQKHILAMSPDAEGAARSQQGQKTIVQSIFPNSTCPWGLEQLLPLLPQCMHLSVLLGWLDMQTVSVRSQRSIGTLVEFQMVTMVTMRGDFQPGCLADRLVAYLAAAWFLWAHAARGGGCGLAGKDGKGRKRCAQERMLATASRDGSLNCYTLRCVRALCVNKCALDASGQFVSIG